MAKGRIPALPFDDFLTYDEVKSFLESLASARPNIARLTKNVTEWAGGACPAH